MDCTFSNVTVLLSRCDDINFNKKINSKDAVDNHKNIKIKRSLRLSRKRSCQDELVRNNNQSNKKKKIMKKRKCNEIKTEEPIPNKSFTKKANNQESTSLMLTKNNLTNRNPNKISGVQNSSSTTVNNKITLPLKTTMKTLKNKISTKCISNKNMSEACNANKSDIFNRSENNVQYSRKRGRPLSVSKTNGIINCDNKVDKQKSKNPAIHTEKLHNILKSESPEMLDDNIMLSKSNKKSSEVEKKQYEDNSSVYIKSNEACSSETAVDSLETVIAATCKELSVTEMTAEDDPRKHLKTFERQIYLLSKRFHISLQTLRNIVIKEPLSVFREKYSKSVTPSMLTVSPIVRMIDEKVLTGDGNNEKDNSNIVYKVEPIRFSEVYEKTNLKDCISELSNAMPSWSLSVVPNPSRYVIYQISINTYGIPIVNKSIVLDRYFRASVYIKQCLQFKYCKRYHTATEIINLIKELNAI